MELKEIKAIAKLFIDLEDEENALDNHLYSKFIYQLAHDSLDHDYWLKIIYNKYESEDQELNEDYLNAINPLDRGIL